MTAKPNSRPPFDQDQDRPVAVSERRPITMPLALLATIVGFTAIVTLGYAALSGRVDAAKETAEQTKTDNVAQEQRIRKIEDAQLQMANDLGWIRRAMEEDRRSRSASASRASNP